MEPYLPSKEAVLADFAKSEALLKEQILRFEKNGLTASDIDLLSKLQQYSLEDIASMSISKLKKAIKDARSSYDIDSTTGNIGIRTITPNLYTRFNKEDIGADETGPYVYFHRNSMNTPYNSIATSAHITEMSNYVRTAKMIGEYIYGTSLTTSQYAGYLFGELWEKPTGNWVHEGIDFKKYEGHPIKSIVNGILTSKYSQLGGTTVSLYKKDTIYPSYICI